VTVRYAFVCDFDGTISPSDIGAEFVRAYSPGREAERGRLLEAWVSGAIGSRELTEAECRLVRVDEAEAVAFVGRFGIDPNFAPFVRAAEARGDRVFVASDGFDFYIEALLGGAGLLRVPRAANRLTFRDGGVVPEFPYEGRGCGRCGNCKGAHARALREAGCRVVVVGDGYSDRCAARVADHVLARGSLAEWCAAEHIPVEPFADFADVARFADRLPGRNGA
jgi:2-hydroxy-3-keto-5-methylthiopentenyl-1-phosphate phosphatase